MAVRSPTVDDFDAHVAASIIAIALGGADSDPILLSDAVGLDGREFRELIANIFPSASVWLELAQLGDTVARTPDEECLLDVLRRGTTSGTPFEVQLAAMIARRAQRPNHLWQDLGLRSRRDLSELMMRHFKPLARRNVHDMKWKKFLYRIICSDASYTLCTAPCCTECDDFNACFGEETGVSLLVSRLRIAG